jgi:hypothetical protein
MMLALVEIIHYLILTSKLFFNKQYYINWPAGCKLFAGQGVIEDIRIVIVYSFRELIYCNRILL